MGSRPVVLPVLSVEEVLAYFKSIETPSTAIQQSASCEAYSSSHLRLAAPLHTLSRPLKRCWIAEPVAEEAFQKPKKPRWNKKSVLQRLKDGRPPPASENPRRDLSLKTSARRPRIPKLSYIEVRTLLGGLRERLQSPLEVEVRTREKKEVLPLRQRALLLATQQWGFKKYKTALLREEALLGRFR